MSEASQNPNEEYFKKKAELSNQSITELLGENAFKSTEQTIPEPGGDDVVQKLPNNNQPEPPEKQNIPPSDLDKNNKDQLSDEALLEALKKRNINIQSLDDLQKTNQEPETPPSPEQRKKSIKEFAEQKKIDLALFDNYENDIKKDPIEILFEQYKSDRNGEVNQDQEPLTEEEMREEFEIEYNLNLDENDPIKKRSLKLISTLRDVILNDRYKSILDIEKEFEADSNSKLSKAEHENETQKAKTNIINTGLKYDLKVIDDENNPIQVNIPIKKEILDKINVPVGTEDVQSSILSQYVADNLGAILYEVAQTYHSKMIEKMAAIDRGVVQRHTDDLAKSGMLVNDAWKNKFGQAGIQTD